MPNKTECMKTGWAGKNWLNLLPLAFIGGLIFISVFGVVYSLIYSTSNGSSNAEKPSTSYQATYQSWGQDVAGYQQALKDQESTKQPILVYFYAPWCGFCKKFHEKLLSNPDVVNAMKGFIKVRTYPDNKQPEMEMMQAFGAEGFPMVYVKTADKPHFEQISMYGPDGELVASQAFINILNQAAK